MSEVTQISSSSLREQPDAMMGSFFADLMQLIKSRLTLLVVITATVGYCLASGENFVWPQFVHAVLGTALVAASAAAFNQLWEMNVDRLMERTRNRPLPSGRMAPATAVWLGLVMGVAGLLQLGLQTTTTATLLAAATLLIYIFLYTPMKRFTSLCVAVGAVSGAIPPVIGWTAVDGSFGLGAWVLFGILFAWQMPHFLAIAWMYRDEYSQAGFVMLPPKDSTGKWTAFQSFLYSVVLTVLTLIPPFSEKTGVVYIVGAILFNLLMLVTSFSFLLKRTRNNAKGLFFASIIYLPGILFLMVFTK